jgi:hypothetical protein
MDRHYDLEYRPDYETTPEIFIQYGSVYKDAFEAALAHYLEHEPMHDYSLAPLVMLLVHYIELSMKGIILHINPGYPYIVQHNLSQLYPDALKELRDKYGDPGMANTNAESFILELGKFDKMSQAFRYPVDRDGKPFNYRTNTFYQKITTLPGLVEISNAVIGDVDGLVAFYDIMRENEEEGWRNADMDR